MTASTVFSVNTTLWRHVEVVHGTAYLMHACMQVNDEFAEAKDGFRDDAELEYGSSSDDEADAEQDAEEDPRRDGKDAEQQGKHNERIIDGAAADAGDREDGTEEGDGAGAGSASGGVGNTVGQEDEDGGEADEPAAKRARRAAVVGHEVSAAAAKFNIKIQHTCAPHSSTLGDSCTDICCSVRPPMGSPRAASWLHELPVTTEGVGGHGESRLTMNRSTYVQAVVVVLCACICVYVALSCSEASLPGVRSVGKAVTR